MRASATSAPQPAPDDGAHPLAWLCEFAGTAILVAVGLSVVCVNFGTGAPLGALPASLRYLLNGLWFAGTGSLLALTPIGRLSGAHINPIVTGAYALLGKMRAVDVAGYIVAQFLGATAGALLLLVAWGPIARSVRVGATYPGPGVTDWAAVGIEAGMGAVEVLVILGMTSGRRTARFTPLALWIVNAVLVWRFAALTGTSLNPARSFGPAVLAPELAVYWVYVIGPAAGMLIGVAAFRLAPFADVVTTKLFHDVRYPSAGASALPVRRAARIRTDSATRRPGRPTRRQPADPS